MNEKEEKAVFDYLCALTNALTDINNNLSLLIIDLQIIRNSFFLSHDKSTKSINFYNLSGYTPEELESPITREAILKHLFPYLYGPIISTENSDDPVTIDPCPKSNNEGG